MFTLIFCFNPPSHSCLRRDGTGAGTGLLFIRRRPPPAAVCFSPPPIWIILDTTNERRTDERYFAGAAVITPELEDNINFTHADARRRRLGAVTLEHLVLVLIDNSSVRRCLSTCNADVESLRQDLEHCIETQTHCDGGRPAPTAEFERVLRRAVLQTRAPHSRGGASGAHVLAAVFAEPGSRAAYYLCKHGVERLAALAHANQKPATAEPVARPAEDNNLVALAAAGRLESPFGRDAEVAEVARILGRKYKNNPLLVGEPGVGKTAIAHKLAHYALRPDAPQSLAGLSLFSVSVGELVAGTKYRGDFEQRMRQLLEKCRARPNAVLFIDEIHTVVGAGAVSGGSLDAANLMKPLLGGGVRCVGATTFAEYRRIFERDAALSRRFHKIDVGEPEEDELRIILSGVAARLSAHHRTEYAPKAAAAAVKYSRRFLPSRFLPDKAIDLLDDAGSRKRLRGDNSPVSERDVAAAARAAAGLPPGGGRETADLAARLSAKVLDQPEAAAHLAAAVLRRRFGYHDNGRTAGAFLFAGPTGVGKTEMARRLAEAMGAQLLRFDMSEYMEAHSVSRLIGAPPGYVGFEQSGGLVEGVVRHPGAVVLLDEIEKAHPDVLNIFLQITDYGALTDNAGRRADFSNAILIMTSNAGAAEWERPPAGFGRADSEAAAAGAEAMSRRFSPEFRNRLDAVVRFMPLSADAISRIVRLRLRELCDRLRADKDIFVQVGRRLRASLARDGFSSETGARPLERLLRARVLDSLAAAEAAGRVAPGGRYYVEENCGGQITAREESKARAPRKMRAH